VLCIYKGEQSNVIILLTAWYKSGRGVFIFSNKVKYKINKSSLILLKTGKNT